MQSVKSYFNTTLFKKNLTRFWPIWSLYLVIWLFALPINLVLEVTNNNSADRRLVDATYFAQKGILEIAESMTVPMAVIFAILVAMAVFSYLYNNRSAHAYHSLPIRREGLFLTSYLSGLKFFTMPLFIVFVLTLIAEALFGYVHLVNLLLWLFLQLFTTVFFYSFAVFCAMFTGNLFALPAFYGILNGLVVFLWAIVHNLLRTYLYGYYQVDGVERVIQWFTPVWMLSEEFAQVTHNVAEVNGIGENIHTFVGLQYAIAYAFFGILLAVVGLLVYRKRHLESAGDVVSQPKMRPVFRYGVATCCALGFGCLLFSIFSYSLGNSPLSLFVWFALCGIIGYFVAEMLLQKSFRVLHRWKGCVVLVACLGLFTYGVTHDFFGFVYRIPAADSVVSVELYTSGTSPSDSANYSDYEITDPMQVEQVLKIHQAFLDYATADGEQNGLYGLSTQSATAYATSDQGAYIRLEVVYTLNNGTTLHRYYGSEYFLPETLDDPESFPYRLESLLNSEELLEQAYNLEAITPDNLEEIKVEVYSPITGETFDQSGTNRLVSTPEEVQMVWSAIQEDFASGNLGYRYLFTESDARLENTCRNDMTIYYWADLDPEGYYVDDNGKLVTTYMDSRTITLTPNATRTISALTILGVFDQENIYLTNAEVNEYELDLEPGVEGWYD